MKVTFVDHNQNNIKTTDLDVLPDEYDHVQITYKDKVETFIVSNVTWVILPGVPYYRVTLNTGGH